jgi:hypothetical protein
MSKQIETYEDLLEEQARLELMLKTQKQLIQQNLQDIKWEAEEKIDSVKKLVTRDATSSVLTSTASTLIDVVLKRGLLSRAGFIPRLLIPFFMKNYSSHYIADHKTTWAKKLFGWLGPKHHNGQVAPPTPSKN